MIHLKFLIIGFLILLIANAWCFTLNQRFLNIRTDIILIILTAIIIFKHKKKY